MAKHRTGQGMIVRYSAFVLLLLLALFSFSSLERFLNGYDAYGLTKVLTEMGSYSLTIAKAISLVFSVVMVFISWRWTMVKPKGVDFLIDVEGEMRKVVWPLNLEGRTIGEKTRELRTSSFVVIGVVMFMAYALYFFDMTFNKMMHMLFGASS